MTVPAADFALALPEIFLLSMACVVLLVDLFIDDSQRHVSYALTQLTLAGAFVLTLMQGSDSALAFNGTFVGDQMANVLKLFVYAIVAAVFVYSRQYQQERGLFKGEYFVLGLFAVLGMMIMISAHSFLTIYLGLELLSLSLYAMVAFDRDSQTAPESAMKYFVLGAIASGMLLYGMSMLYGMSGSLDIQEVADYLTTSGEERNIALIFGLCFVIVGLAFKLGAVPFHMWLPDVYHGAPTSVTLFIGTAPKIAAFAMMMRMLAEGLGGLLPDWQDMLIVLAVLSIGIGNIVAIAQTNIKRMFAYSTIAHVGFLLLGILAGTRSGYASAMFYILVYSIMSLGGFGMILLLSRRGFEADEIEDFKGLNERSPWFAFMMLLLMFSMTGVPPTVGFYAKLAVLQAVIQVDLIWLAVYAVIMSIVGAYYYLRIVRLMYFDSAEDTTVITPRWDVGAVMSANGVLMLLLGLFPGGLMALCAAALAGP